MHELIASPFLGHYLVVRPGRPNGMKIPYARYKELAQADPGDASPAWLTAAARQAWNLDLSDRPRYGAVLVRPESPFGYGRAETLPSQSAAHLRKRRVFTGCNAGHTFFHVDPHGKASICKVGREPNVSLMDEGVEGLASLGRIADGLLLRQGAAAAAV